MSLTWLTGDVTTVAWCWRLDLKDGTIMGFTSHDSDLAVDGVTYEAATGFNPTAVDTSKDMAVDNMEVDGFLDSSSITVDDIVAGRFDFAEVTVFLCNWSNVNDEKLVVRKGTVGKITNGKYGFQAEIRGIMQAYQQAKGEVYQKHCRATLGDNRCKVMLVTSFDWAYMPGANFTNAYLDYGSFINTVMTGATLGVFNHSRFVNAKLDGITSSSLYCNSNEYVDCDLSNSTHMGISFNNAVMRRCKATNLNISGYLGGCKVSDTVFDGSDFSQLSVNSTMFYNSTMRNTKYVNAFIGFDVTVDNCDLTNADFTDTALMTFTLKDSLLGGNNFPEASTPSSYWPVTTGTYQNKEIEYRGFNKAYVVLYHPTPSTSPPAQGQRFINQDFSYQNFAGKTLSGYFEGCDFTGCCLDNAVLSGNFTSCNFSNIHAVNADFSASAFYSNNGTYTPYYGKVTAVGSDGSITTDISSSAMFEYGTLQFTSGDNEGYTYEIKSHASGTFTLFLPTANRVSVGDTVIAYPGCDGNLSTCKNVYNNVFNFRGEPFIPGNDYQASYPNKAAGNVTSA